MNCHRADSMHSLVAHSPGYMYRCIQPNAETSGSCTEHLLGRPWPSPNNRAELCGVMLWQQHCQQLGDSAVLIHALSGNSHTAKTEQATQLTHAANTIWHMQPFYSSLLPIACANAYI